MQKWSPTRVLHFLLSKKFLTPCAGEHVPLSLLVSTMEALGVSSICERCLFPRQPAVSFCRAKLGCERQRHQSQVWCTRARCGTPEHEVKSPRLVPLAASLQLPLPGTMSAVCMQVHFLAQICMAWLREEAEKILGLTQGGSVKVSGCA